MELLFENNTKFGVTEDLLERLRGLICDSLVSEGVSTDIQVGLTFVEKEEIQRLNREHRGIDSVTDVLSFPMYDFNIEKPVFGKGEVCLGDIVICVDRAREQSVEYGHSLERELGFLTVHSMLHLMGYDHMNEEEEKVMFDKQRNILDKAGLKR